VTIDRVAIEARGATSEARLKIARHAVRRGFQHVVVRPEDRSEFPESVQRIERNGESLRSGPKEPMIPIVQVGSPAALERAMKIGAREGAVAVAWVRERVIPLENLLADAASAFQVWVLIDKVRDLPGALGALEHGADMVVASADSVASVDTIEAAIESRPYPLKGWTTVRVQSVRPAGMGDRVLVDTTSVLRPAEGLLVGSAAAFLFHVASEAEGSTYTRPRSFRVNAGAAHSYVLLADGTTRYLSELAAGDAMLVTEPGSTGRSVRVGRIKIERRPMTLIEATIDGHPRTLFVQEAETVRVSGTRGRVAVTELRPGERILGVRLSPGRHMGRAIEETIEER
jgi:3-dehydroquinate synthase II